MICNNCKQDKPQEDFERTRKNCRKCTYILRRERMMIKHPERFIKKERKKSQSAIDKQNKKLKDIEIEKESGLFEKKCDICDMIFYSMKRYMGHRGGHVRRGELAKLSIRKPYAGKRLECNICNKVFENGSQRRTYELFHNRKWEDLKTDCTRRKQLIFENGRKCEVCNSTEWMGKDIPIELDHIDGNPENNTKENCRLICPNCHAQTETYKGKNTGKVENSKRKNTLLKYRYKYR